MTFPTLAQGELLTTDNLIVTLREVIARLDEFADDETIYAASTMPTVPVVVAAEPMTRCGPPHRHPGGAALRVEINATIG